MTTSASKVPGLFINSIAAGVGWYTITQIRQVFTTLTHYSTYLELLSSVHKTHTYRTGTSPP